MNENINKIFDEIINDLTGKILETKVKFKEQ